MCTYFNTVDFYPLITVGYFCYSALDLYLYLLGMTIRVLLEKVLVPGCHYHAGYDADYLRQIYSYIKYCKIC